MHKIAFLFLTIGNVYHEQAWVNFFRGHEHEYSVYVHPKIHVPMASWFKPFEMRATVRSTWSNTMRAQVHILREALKDRLNEKFVFVSESTIPLQSFDYVYDILMSTPKSMFSYAKNPHQRRSDPYYDSRNLKKIKRKHRYKNSQWIVLNRKHAELMARDNVYLDLIASHYGSDQELYPATFLASQGLLDEIIPRDCTYVNWELKNPGDKQHPYIFTDLSDPVQLACLIEARNQGYLFARKFAPTVSTRLVCP